MDQKTADFQALAGLYAKRYGPYEWKRDVFGVDALNIAPWLEKVRAAKDDLAFYEICVEYVGSLNDAHDTYTLPSNFVALLHFGVDIYDGKLLVDNINRTRLPTAEFPFVIGYELVSIDGADADKLLDGLLKYSIAANPRSTRRLAAELLTIRVQQLMPAAASVPEISTVVFRRPDGELETYRIPWAKSGVPLTSVGKYSGFRSAAAASGESAEAGETGDPSGYRQVLRRLETVQLPRKSVIGFGGLTPVFARALPPNFVQRLGRAAADPFFSGTYVANGQRIGFIRIPGYSPANLRAAADAFLKEIRFFEANTDGLVVDEMRNPGGFVSYTNVLLSMLMPRPWDSIPFRVRATSSWVVSISAALEAAKLEGEDEKVLQLLEMLKEKIVDGNRSARELTEPIPLDGLTIEREPFTDDRGRQIAYSKPLIVLVDEMSASGGDYFPATIQDNGRGLIVGWRTMGAGGSVVGARAGNYSEGFTSVTESLMIRKRNVSGEGYPLSPYIENIGVEPDVKLDYMIRDNLMLNGRPFVDWFTRVMLDHILSSR